jgi:DNA-binding beta-propeller fold protein YncE
MLAVTLCAMVMQVSGCGGGMIPTPDPHTGNLVSNGVAVGTGQQPFRIVTDAAGRFAFVVNENASGVSIFKINTDGTLTRAGMSFAGSTPVSMAITGSTP